MKNVTFYLLKHNTYQDDFSPVEQLACKIATEYWRKGKRILIACKDQQEAIHLDKALWVYPPDSFVPHNLSGEGPNGGAPIEIAWPKAYKCNARDILISLCVECTDFAIEFTEVVDFVPHERFLIQLARERYKAYRLSGFNLNTIT